MKKLLFALLLLGSFQFVLAQDEHEDGPPDTTWKKDYRGSNTVVNDLNHTKLDIRFDYSKSYAYGKVWLTLKPHFYPTDLLTLDAKGMDIKQVSLVKGSTNSPLKYDYDGLILTVKLDKK